jgi:hypothetical protein
MKSARSSILLALATIIVCACFTSVSNAAGIPDLKGPWKFVASGYDFRDVLRDGVNPKWESATSTGKITHQKGRTFAGRFTRVGHEVKMTGVILEDNTVHIQVFTYHSRAFLLGRYSVINGKATIRAASHQYDDFNLSSEPSIQTFYYTMTKTP